MTNQPHDHFFAEEPDHLFVALRHALSRCGYKVLDLNEIERVLVCNSGISWRSWEGQNVCLSVISAPGGSLVRVEMGRSQDGPLACAQLVSWGEAAAVEKKILAGLTNMLATLTPGSSPPAPESAPNVTHPLSFFTRTLRRQYAMLGVWEVPPTAHGDSPIEMT